MREQQHDAPATRVEQESTPPVTPAIAPATKPGRPNAVRYIGPTDGNGTPLVFWEGVPARNLTAADIAALTDEQAAQLTATLPEVGGPIYAIGGASRSSSREG